MNICLQKMELEDLECMNLKNFDDFWSESILKEEILSPYSYFIIAKLENDIIGFAGIKFILDEVHIINIVTRKDKRDIGVRF